jgi:5-methylthioadenosine/S-adenosylhomocysteine deaminase
MTTALSLAAELVLDPDGFARRRPVHVSAGRFVAQAPTGAETVVLNRRLLVPGMINAHHHSNEAWHRGRFDRMPLESWMLFAYPPLADPPETPREAYVRTCLTAIETLRTGATCVIDFLYEPGGNSLDQLDAVVGAYRDAGVRAVIALGMADERWRETIVADWSLVPRDLLARLDEQTPPPWSHWEALAREAVARHHDPEAGISIALGPSGPQRCSDTMLAGCAALAAELDLTIHIHVLETRMQVLSGLRRTGTTLPKHLDALGFLSERVTFEHGIWLEPDDVELLAERGITVAHNPASNQKLGSGICPVGALRRAGVAVALGSDGTSSNDGADLLATVKLAALLHRGPGLEPSSWLGASDAWEMATHGGALAAGDPVGLGSLTATARADAVAFDLDHFAFTPMGDPINHLGFCAPTGAITDVLLGGRWAMRDRVLCLIDEPGLLAEARALAPGILARRHNANALAVELSAAVDAGWREAMRG